MTLRVRLSDLLFLANFGVAKVMIYATPLIVAGLAGRQLYGSFEFALALGLQISALILGAPLAGFTQLYLVHKEKQHVELLTFLTFGPTLVLLFGTLAMGVVGAPMAIRLATSAVALTIAQNTVSTLLRTLGRRNLTAWADSMSILLGGAAIATTVFISGPNNLRLATTLFTIIAAGLVAASGCMLLQRRPIGLAKGLKRATMIGIPMMIVGLFGTWIAVCGRLLLGLFNATDVAAYSLAFRIAGLALGVHQLTTTAAFPRLYSSRVRPGDKLLSLFLSLAFVVCAILSIAGPLIPRVIRFTALTDASYTTFRALVPAAALHTFLWVGFALLQMRIGRFRIAGKLVLPLLISTLGGGAIIATAMITLSTGAVLVAWMTAAQAAAYFAVTWWVLARNRLPHGRTALTGLLGTVALATIGAIMAAF